MPTGFFTDTTLCIGCKACEVACKQWNELPADGFAFSGASYDNTLALSGTTWRHVVFSEEARDGSVHWLMCSDVCKHCEHAGCLEACPTGAIIRNEFGNVFVQPDVCNGCGYCVVSCPFGVVDLIEDLAHVPEASTATLQDDRLERGESALQGRGGVAGKCTLCYDRQRSGMIPACAKACPTESIRFGDLDELRAQARRRVDALRERGIEARLYGADDVGDGIGRLGAFFLLTAEPERYGLPERPVLPSRRQREGYAAALLAAAAIAATGWLLFRGRRDGRGGA
jgi:formate dehydrogenase iron-sulfur subunit